MNLKPILYAEDEDNDVIFMQHAWQKAGLLNPLIVMGDGREAIEYLAGTGRYADRQQHPLPCLVLLDLKLPHKSGLDVLEWMRAHPALLPLPAVMVTSSNQDSDILRSHTLGASAYLIKPPTADKLKKTIKSLKEFWLDTNPPLPDPIGFAHEEITIPARQFTSMV
jgi:CheY-like chemotaxis protein